MRKRIRGDGLCFDCGAKTRKSSTGLHYEAYCEKCFVNQVAAIDEALSCDDPDCHICAFRRGFDAAWLTSRRNKR